MKVRGLSFGALALVACNSILGNQDRHLTSADAGASSGEQCPVNGPCIGGSLCVFQACQPPCTGDGDCDAGSRCLETGAGAVCVSSSTALCAAGCPAGSSCSTADGACRNACDTSQCLDGQTCTGGFCVSTAAHEGTAGGDAGGMSSGGGENGGSGNAGTGGAPTAGTGEGGGMEVAGAPDVDAGPPTCTRVNQVLALPDGGAYTCHCVTGTTSTCGAALGAKGNCASGMTQCALGEWGPCSILPKAADTCTSGDDSTCDGDSNVGCACSSPTAHVACGACSDGTKTCNTASGTYGSCVGAYVPGGSCTASNGCAGTTDCTKTCKTTGNPGQSCTASNGCPGSTDCSNNCNTSGNPGQSCTASNGCPGSTDCSNNCNTSGNPGQSCTASNGCAGSTDCSNNCNATQSRVNWSGGMNSGSITFTDSNANDSHIATFSVVGGPQFAGAYTFSFQTGQTGNVDNTSNIQTMQVECSDISSVINITGNQICSGGAKSCPSSAYNTWSITCPWGTGVVVSKLQNAGGGCCGGYDKTVYAGSVVVSAGSCG
jgi:hypothetical protein